jgi:hypothetical protein
MGHSDWGSEKSTRSKWEWEVMRKCVYETGAVTNQKISKKMVKIAIIIIIICSWRPYSWTRLAAS